MILHPEVFAKAQAEIDRVVGTDRLPDFQDRTSLPYVESLVKEVYRYGSPSPNDAPLSHAYDCVKLALPRPSRSVMRIPLHHLRLDCSSNRVAVPHRSIKDDQYRGYDIPADTMIIPNVWSADMPIYYHRSSFSYHLM
jgi:hypothetical protein